MSRFIRIDDVSGDERTAFFADLLPEDITGERRCRLIGAVDEKGIPEGMIAFGIEENNIDILHVEVYEELRRQGIGTALITTLLRYLAPIDLPFMVQAIYSVGDDGDGESVDHFFRSLQDFVVIKGSSDLLNIPAEDADIQIAVSFGEI